MKKIILLTLMTSFLTAGCSMQSWKYSAEQKIYKKPEIQHNLVVPPLRDSRDSENSMSGYFISMIPLVPYGTSEFNVPDQMMPNAKFVEEFSKALAEEIENASIFKSSMFQFGKTGGDFYLLGNLKKSQKIWNSTFYGLSPLGDLLWIIGLPNGKYHFYIEIDISLIDKNGKTYFVKNYSGESSNLTGLYYGMGKNSFEKILKEIALELIKDLKEIAPTLKMK